MTTKRSGAGMTKPAGETVSDDKQWDIKCAAAIIGIYGAMKLCDAIGLDLIDLAVLVRDNQPRFEAAEREAAKLAQEARPCRAK